MPKKKLEKEPKKSIKDTKSKGLGDTLEKVFKKTGIDKVAKWVLGEDCGCDDRKEKLNYLFPYYKPECLTEDEFEYLDKYFKANKSTVHPQTQKKLLSIFNRVFHQNKKMTSCGSCFKKELHNKLHRVYLEYLDE
ncbi:hypothetical protein [uncultured Mediterranean phage uvDeep1-CGR2-KM23-C896]|jgi:hypothetical protein|nr:hypothetical protein [uncultured Mediterranean phage uvDeep1-CGR2-KM23-C896]|tara:strand:+ start:479 stop:883 length:405 start_codon:yes stop_codon:yes gene_type:complete